MNNLSASPPNKQPTEELSSNPDSPDTVPSDVQSDAVVDSSELPVETSEKSQEPKSNRRNPLTWFRNKSNDTASEDTPVTPKSIPTQIPQPEKTPPKTVPASSFSEIKLFAPLDTVGTENYLRYGVEGPRHYVMGLIESVPTPEDITIQLEIVGSDSIPKFNTDDIQLKRLAHEPQHHTVWGIHATTLHTQIIWIWDFFRMLSSIQLRVEIPPQSASKDDQWPKLATILQSLTPDDKLTVRVQNNVGTITQIYAVQA